MSDYAQTIERLLDFAQSETGLTKEICLESARDLIALSEANTALEGVSKRLEAELERLTASRLKLAEYLERNDLKQVVRQEKD